MTPTSPSSDEHATDADVEAAIRVLSAADFLRLRRYGDRRAACLRARGVGVDGDDLLQQAIEKTLNQERKWPKKRVGFVSHLMRTMSSTASHAKKKHDDVRPSEEIGGDADSSSVASPFAPLMPSPEVEAAAQEQLAQIEERFADDVEATFVIDGHKRGLTGPEIQRDLGMTQREYETVMTRIRRGLDRKAGWRP